MCNCSSPNINGNFGYRWNGESVGTHSVNPPELIEAEVLLFDFAGMGHSPTAECETCKLASALRERSEQL